MSFYKLDEEKIRLYIKLKPNAKQEKVLDTCTESSQSSKSQPQMYLHIAIKAPAAENKANKALIDFVAKSLALPKSTISLERGSKSKYKTLSLKTPQTLTETEAQILIDKLKSS